MRLLPIFLAAMLAAPGACLADTADVGPATPVAPVVVDATRIPILLNDTPDVVVIDRAAIDLRQAVYAADVLTLVPGVTVADNGAFGGVASVRMRGASSDKTLVLLDGVPQNDPSDPNGAYDFSHLDLAGIERIEVLEGPQSSIWGSDAIGGVISLTSRELDGWLAQGEGGSLATFDGSAGFGRRTDAWAFGAEVFGDRSDGVAKADGIGPRNPFWSWSAAAYGRLTPANWLTLDTHLRYEQSRAAIDGYDAATFAFGYTPQTYATRGLSWSGRAVAETPLGFTDTVTIGVRDLDRADVYAGQPADSSAYSALTQDYRFTAERGAATDPWGVVFGAERQVDDASLSTGLRESLGTTSGFVEGRWRPLAPLTVTAAERYDAPDRFGGDATGHVSAVWKLGAGFSLEGAWGQGFKTPTISEIACDVCFRAGPSVGLKPEHAEGWDGALAWASADGAWSARLTGYRLDVRDQLEFSASFPFRYVNLARTRTDGVELQLGARLSPNLTLEGEYAYTDARDLVADAPVLRVPRDTGSVSLLWNSRRWQAALTVRSEGPDADENPSTFLPQPRPGFVLVNLSGAYAVSRHLDLTARIENVANTHYQEVLGYGEPKQMLFIGFRARE